MSILNRSLCLLILIGSGLATTGCEEGIEPFTNTDRYFTVFGYLDTDAETQYVRVIPLRKLIDVPPPGPIDAEVSSIEMETGETITWSDSLVEYSDGTNGHVFYAHFSPRFNHTYRIEVRRSDGGLTHATTQVPPNVEALIHDPVNNVTGAGTRVTQRVEWSSVDYDPFNVQVWYRFEGSRPDRPFRQIFLNYTDDDLGQFQSGSWQIRLDLTEDRRRLLEAIGQDPDQAAGFVFPYTLYGIGVQVATSDAAWRPPGDVFNPEVLIQPGTLSNVENGFGFFGSVAQLKTEWILTPERSAQLGYPYPR